VEYAEGEKAAEEERGRRWKRKEYAGDVGRETGEKVVGEGKVS
jgi:hypothetical protein